MEFEECSNCLKNPRLAVFLNKSSYLTLTDITEGIKKAISEGDDFQPRSLSRNEEDDYKSLLSNLQEVLLYSKLSSDDKDLLSQVNLLISNSKFLYKSFPQDLSDDIEICDHLLVAALSFREEIKLLSFLVQKLNVLIQNKDMLDISQRYEYELQKKIESLDSSENTNYKV